MFKKGDIVVVLEDVTYGRTIYLKAGEFCEVCNCEIGDNNVLLQSLSPSFGSGNWYSKVGNIDYALEMFRVLS
jgi:hypothetical protein